MIDLIIFSLILKKLLMKCIGIYDVKLVCSVVMDKILKNVILLDIYCIVIYEVVMIFCVVVSRDVGGVIGVIFDDCYCFF